MGDVLLLTLHIPHFGPDVDADFVADELVRVLNERREPGAEQIMVNLLPGCPQWLDTRAQQMLIKAIQIVNLGYADPADQESQGPPVRRRGHRPFSELTHKIDGHPDAERLRAEAQAGLDAQLDAEGAHEQPRGDSRGGSGGRDPLVGPAESDPVDAHHSAAPDVGQSDPRHHRRDPAPDRRRQADAVDPRPTDPEMTGGATDG